MTEYTSETEAIEKAELGDLLDKFADLSNDQKELLLGITIYGGTDLARNVLYGGMGHALKIPQHQITDISQLINQFNQLKK